VRRHHRLRRTRREHVDVDAVNALIDLALASAGEPVVPPAPSPRDPTRKRLLVGHGRLPRRRIRIYRSGIGWRRLAPASDSRV